MDSNDKLLFPKFEENSVSTNTFILITNFNLNIKKIFDFLPVTEYFVTPKKRGRKKKIDSPDLNEDIKDGSIITIEYENKLKGIDLKNKLKKNNIKQLQQQSTGIQKKQPKTGERNFFRNSITLALH